MGENTIYYISEAAKKVQVEAHVLRYWEDELQLGIKRNEMGHRCYSGEDIERLQQIKLLKEQGLQLKAIRTVLFGGGMISGREGIRLQNGQDITQDNMAVYKAEQDNLANGGEVFAEVQQVEAHSHKSVPEYRQEQTAYSERAGHNQGQPEPNQAAGQSQGKAGRDQAAAQKHAQAGRDQAAGRSHAQAGCNQAAGHSQDMAGDEQEEKIISMGSVKDMEDVENMEHKVDDMIMRKAQKYMVTLSKGKEPVIETPRENLSAFVAQADMDKTQKAARLQYLLQHMITEAVKSANQEMCTEIKESILKELDYQFRQQEERDEEHWKKEEEHYRKIDEMIRQRHLPKEKPLKGKRKSPISL